MNKLCNGFYPYFMGKKEDRFGYCLGFWIGIDIFDVGAVDFDNVEIQIP